MINGDGQQTRDFVHADDLAAAVEAVLGAPEDDIAGELFQAGTGVETTVAALADEIGRAVGRQVEVRHGPARAGDIERNVGPGRQGGVSARVSARRSRWPTGWRGPRPGSRPPSRTRPWPESRPTRRRAPSDPAPMTASSEAPSAPLPILPLLGWSLTEPPAGVAAVARCVHHDRHPLRAGHPHLRHRHRARPAARSVGQGSFRPRPALLAARGPDRRLGDGPGARGRRRP